MTSCDIIGMIEGGGVGLRGGEDTMGHGNVDQLSVSLPTSSPVTPTLNVISVHHEEDHFKI